ncbi:MAG: hypothetical protein KGI52_18400 [Burkholderiales bacterium]|nr:hypothetical protein [Burkholderiales bacterium]
MSNPLTRSDFENWKADPVTKAFFYACQERIEDAKNILANQAGINSVEDNLLRGFIRAYQEMQEFRVEDEE